MFKKIPALMLLCAIPWIIGMTKPVRAEYIGINELQTEANIEWKKDYVDRYGRTVSVDVTPIIPQVDKVPIQIMENQILPVENVLNIYPQSMVQEEKREEDNVIIMNYLNQDKNERGAVYICQNDGNLVLFEYDDLNTKIKKTTTKLESFSGIQYCSNEVERLYPYFDGYDFTVQDSIDCANQELGKFFPDYNLDLDIMWVTIVPNTRPCYVCTLRQKIDGIPILMGAGDIARGTNEKEMGFKFPKSWKTKGEEYWGGFIRSLWDFIAYVDGGYQIQFRPLKKVVSLVDDVPLCTFDEVISSVEKQIEHGNIRNVYEMRFGYCCYLDENEQIVLYPVWQIECDYFFNPKEEQKHYAEMEDGQVTLGLDYHRFVKCKILGPKKLIERRKAAMLRYEGQTAVISCMCPPDDRMTFESDIYQGTIEMPFENIMIKVPVNYDTILRKYYGDYMELPPENQRVSAHHFKAFFIKE